MKRKYSIEEINEIINNATKLYGYEVIITDEPKNEEQIKHFERGRDWAKQSIINSFNILQ
jgi:hypothetical protein